MDRQTETNDLEDIAVGLVLGGTALFLLLWAYGLVTL